MTRNTALAGAARRVRALSERIPTSYRPDLAAEWANLLAAIEGRTDRQAKLLIAQWVEDQETRLTARLANAPLQADEPVPVRGPQ